MRWYEYKMEVDDLHASEDLKAKLLAMQTGKTAPEAPAKTVTAIKPEPVQKKPPIRFPTRRGLKLLAACAAFCIVAVGAASVLHIGSIGIGGAKSSTPVAAFSSQAAATGNASTSSAYAMADAPELASYAMDSGRAVDSSDNSAVLRSSALEHSETQTKHTTDASKIIYTANLTLESKDYDAAQDALNAALSEAGGYLESSNESTYTGSSRNLSLTLRVPQANYQSFLEAAAAAGNLVNKSEQAEDVTSQYMDLEARLENLTAQRTRLQELQASADNLSDLLEIESSLSDVQYQLESYQSQLDWYSQQVECCTVNISLEEVQTYTPTDESFGSQIVDAFHNGLSDFLTGLQNLTVTLVMLWPVLVLLAAVAVGVLGWKAHRTHRK